jgi:hypothetical protein
MLFRRISIISFFLFFFLPIQTYAALGCCVVLREGKTDATSQQDVGSCFPLLGIGDCNTYKTNNGVKTVWREKACSSLPVCASRAPSNCCKSVANDVTTKCIPTENTSSCNIFIQSAKQEILKDGKDPSGFIGKQTDGSCAAQTDCAGKILDVAIYSNIGSNQSNITEEEDYIPEFITPKLAVNVPGVNFSALKVQGYAGQKYIDVPYLAQYVQGIYSYVMALVVILSIAVIIWGGIKWISAAGNAEMVSSAKKNITNAIIGIFFAFGSFLILSTINPDLVNLKVLRIAVIQRLIYNEYKKMQDTFGFKDVAASQYNEEEANRLYSGLDGNSPLIAPGEGESISISGINATGKPYEKLRAYCSKKADAANMSTYSEKINALVRAVLGWKKVCVDEKGCAYVRGGYTDLGSGKVQPGASDIPFLLNFLDSRGLGREWGAECETKWINRPSGDNFYALRKTPEYSIFEFVQKAVGEDTPEDGPGMCWIKLSKQYKRTYLDNMSNAGLFGGDCGTTLLALYRCAGGATKPISSLMAWSGKDPSNYVVFAAKDKTDFVAQVNAKGGLRFGDIFVIGKENWQHNFMFTGGREDVPFMYFEMGSGGPGDGIDGTWVNIPGANFGVGGMQARLKTGDFFFWDKPKYYPITVIRPYDVTSCASRNQCGVGESCHCTASDSPTNINGALNNNSCSMANVCHKVKTGTFCNDDEHCPNGQTCQSNSCG